MGIYLWEGGPGIGDQWRNPKNMSILTLFFPIWRTDFVILSQHFRSTFCLRSWCNNLTTAIIFLCGGFKYFSCSPLFAEYFHFDQYFSTGLKTPTSFQLGRNHPSISETYMTAIDFGEESFRPAEPWFCTYPICFPWICLVGDFFTDWDPMGFITIKAHHLDEYVLCVFSKHRTSKIQVPYHFVGRTVCSRCF